MTDRQHWTISFLAEGDDGFAREEELSTHNESQARSLARENSRAHSSAVMNNHQGLIVAYVNGEVWKPEPRGDVVSITQATWNGEQIDVEERWLDRAKEIVREHGIVDASKIMRMLEREMGLPELSGLAVKLILIAVRDTAPERRLSEKCECRCNEGRHCGGCGHSA
jgi:hypothetical protein